MSDADRYAAWKRQRPSNKVENWRGEKTPNNDKYISLQTEEECVKKCKWGRGEGREEELQDLFH